MEKTKYEKLNSENAIYKHITALFSALDSGYNRSNVVSACERPCVCVCVCRHGKSAVLDFSKRKDLEKGTEKLFKRALAA
ncbi:MAG TPA: hypothetical protein VJ438_05670 [Candidatus Nanoarchaeia archaeon]|nr:hypothetical protein [Candidatus Nanoarchaeia archaeon]